MQALGGLCVSPDAWIVDAAERPPVNVALTVDSTAIREKPTS
jgi:hypothetical protein